MVFDFQGVVFFFRCKNTVGFLKHGEDLFGEETKILEKKQRVSVFF